MSSKSKISVIIPTLNSWNTLGSCITSIFKQTLKPEELIVVDNASSDGTWEKISNLKSRAANAEQISNLKLVRNKQNLGVTGGRNAGISIANKNSQYLLFFDHDMVADKNMLLNLVKVAEMDSSYGIITPKIYYWEDKKRIWAAGTNINLWTGQVLFRGGRDVGQFEKIEEVQVAPAVMLVCQEVIHKLKGFDSRYFATYEDTDFCFRAKDKGFKTIYSPKAFAYHKISPKKNLEQKRLLDRSFWIGRNRVLFMRDFGKSYYLFLLFSPVYLLYFIKLALQQKNPKGLTSYLKGFIAGMLQANKS